MHRRTATVVTGALLALLLTAVPAAADPARPTNYRSDIETVTPATTTIRTEIFGGDAFFVLTVAPGSSAMVYGYEGEPYVRYHADGIVERNVRSPARWLNDARYGAADVTPPPDASANAPPRWEVVATGGTYAWHDHRVHWMSPRPSGRIDVTAQREQLVQEWTVDLTVDDEPIRVAGRLTWLPSTSPIMPAAAGLLILAAGLLLLRRPTTVPLAVTVGAVAAGAVGAAMTFGLPAGAQADPFVLVLPGIALALVGLATGIRRRRRSTAELVAALSGVPILVWAVLQVGALTAPIVPTTMPTSAARILVAVALATSVVALVGAARLLIIRRDDTDGDADVPSRTDRRPRPGHGLRATTLPVLTLAIAQPFILAHAGAGATWQAMLTVASLALVVVFVLVLIGKITLDGADDLVMPLAAVVIVSSAAPLGSYILSDWVGWAFPLGVVTLVTLLLAAFTPVRISFREPPAYGAIALAIFGAITLYLPITRAWHPVEFLPLADDAIVSVELPDGTQAVDGRLLVAVSVEGGSFGGQEPSPDRVTDDPEEAGILNVRVNEATVEVDFLETCTIDAPCTEVTFHLDVAPGQHSLWAELVRGDGMPFAPAIYDRAVFDID